MKKPIIALLLSLFVFIGHTEAAKAVESQIEIDARELLVVLGNLPDNPRASSIHQNELMKKRAATDILSAYFAKYTDKKTAANALITEMQGLKKRLPIYSMGPLMTAIQIYTHKNKGGGGK